MPPTAPNKYRAVLIGTGLASLAFGYAASIWLESRNAWREDDRFAATETNITDLAQLPDFKSLSNVQTDSAPTDSPATSLRFTELKDAIPDFRYNNGATGLLHLAETLGGGGAAADIDNDGNTELIFVDGSDPLNPTGSDRNSIAVFRQMQQGRFTNISEVAGCQWKAYGHGCAAADFDNDGFTDLLFTGYGSLTLLRNMGDGTFVNWTAASALESSQWNATASFGDLDSDGDVDLYVTGYADVPASAPEFECEQKNVRIHCHPHYWDSIADRVFENLGDGTFTDRTSDWNIDDEREYGLGVVISDLIEGGSPEIFVANDGDRNLLLQREQDGQLVDVGTESGIAFDGNGQSTGSMGIAVADFDSTGQLDLLTTNFIRERNVLFRNLGNGVFVDDSEGSTIDQTSRSLVGWGAVAMDANNDLHADLFIANGHVSDIPETDYRQLPLLLQGGAKGKFRLTTAAGPYFETKWHGRGAFMADVGGDQRKDIIVCHIDDPPSILINESIDAGKMLIIKLVGRQSTRDGFNTVVTAKIGSTTLKLESIQSEGYLSTSSRELQIATGQSDRIDLLTIRWQSGHITNLTDVQAGQTLVIVENGDSDVFFLNAK